MTFFYVVISISLVSVLSLIGIFTLFIKRAYLDKALFVLVSFAIGSLLGAAFLDLLPEAIQMQTAPNFIFALFGIVVFFILEKFLFWYHCHKGECDIHTFKYMNLIGDGIHNFIDGMIIATAFMAGKSLGFVTTVAILLHEIPQELGDFGILCYGGFSRRRALFYNFLFSLTAFLGAFVAFALSGQPGFFTHNILLFAAGGFIYIACTDLMPELGKEINLRRSFYQFVLIFLGIGIIWLAKSICK